MQEEQEQLKQELIEVMRLGSRIEARIGRPVKVRVTKTAVKWAFYAPKNFAYARKIESRECLRISSKEEWAARAGVNKSRDGISPKGWWGEPSVWWDMCQYDALSLEKVATILARVSEARHH